jgi:hypothetical protein
VRPRQFRRVRYRELRRLRPVSSNHDPLEQGNPFWTPIDEGILNAVPRSWIISMVVLIACLLASMVIASIKLF